MATVAYPSYVSLDHLFFAYNKDWPDLGSLVNGYLFTDDTEISSLNSPSLENQIYLYNVLKSGIVLKP